MKEEKYWLDTPQRIFLEKVIQKIEGGKFKVYGTSTMAGLKDILDRGYYTNTQKGWLNTVREDYLETFCRTTMYEYKDITSIYNYDFM